MEIVTKKGEHEVTFVITGRIDTNTAPDLETTVIKELVGMSKVILDFTNVEYISSAGLRVILMIYKTLNGSSGELVISHAKDSVMEIFDMTGFSSFLIFED